MGIFVACSMHPSYNIQITSACFCFLLKLRHYHTPCSIYGRFEYCYEIQLCAVDSSTLELAYACGGFGCACDSYIKYSSESESNNGTHFKAITLRIILLLIYILHARNVEVCLNIKCFSWQCE